MARRFLSFPPLFSLPAIIFFFVVIFSASPTEKIQSESLEFQAFLPFTNLLIETKSQFTTKVLEKKQKVPYEVKYQKDPNLAWGQNLKSQQGVPGYNLKITEILIWQGIEFDKRTYTKVIIQPQPQISLIGTKFTPGEIETPFGKLAYKGKMRAFATSYDKNCKGCNETTATGARLSYGIVAVDPKIIPLGSKVYVPIYGIAAALDTGGAIKGARIDLAFDDVKNGFWRSRWTEVYLLE